MNTMIKAVGMVLALAGCLARAQAPVKLVTQDASEVIVGATGKRYTSGMTTVNNTNTTITAVTTKVQVMWCRNNSGADTTISVLDGNSEVYLPVQTLLTKQAVKLFESAVGITFTNGVVAVAGANSAIKCHVEGAQ